MELQPPGTPVRDPFFAAVRRRHPDVDLVLLPDGSDPAGPEPATAEPVADGTVAETLERVAAAAHRVWAATAPGSDRQPEARVGFGPAPGTVVATARVVTRAADGHHRLAGLRDLLDAEGWQLRQQPGAVDLVTGRRHDVGLRATYAEATGALVLELTSAPMYVGTAPARAMARRS